MGTAVGKNDSNQFEIEVENVDDQNDNEPASPIEAAAGSGADDSKQSIQEEEAADKAPRRIFEINTIFEKTQLDRQYPNNAVSTTKYTSLTFLPKNLFEQFSKMANFYFLFLIVLQIVPGIGQAYGSLFTAMPLTFVVSISMIKDAYEDRQRYL